VDHAAELGGTVAPRPLRAEHILGLRFRDGTPPGLVEQLRERKIFVSIRGGTVRIAPHLFTSASDVDRLLDALRRRAA
jgi:selenocysteine lyase/cysteine desulfurase